MTQVFDSPLSYWAIVQIRFCSLGNILTSSYEKWIYRDIQRWIFRNRVTKMNDDTCHKYADNWTSNGTNRESTMGTRAEWSSLLCICIPEFQISVEYKFSRVISVAHGRPWSILFLPQCFCCYNFTKNIENHSQTPAITVRVQKSQLSVEENRRYHLDMYVSYR